MTVLSTCNHVSPAVSDLLEHPQDKALWKVTLSWKCDRWC